MPKLDAGAYVGHTYAFDVERAVAALCEMNNSPAMLAADRLLHQHFRGLYDSLSKDGIAENVVLLDGVWGTRLFMEQGASDGIIQNLQRKARRLVALFEALDEDELMKCPQRVVDVSVKVLPVILEHSPDANTKYRRNYSFATKFYHWVTRHHFPIVDSRARRRVNAMQREAGVSPRVRSDTAAMQGLTYVEEYARWIGFYSDLIAGLGDDERHRLRRADRDFQRRHCTPVENSLLRILDKVLYIQGGGSSLGRFGT